MEYVSSEYRETIFLKLNNYKQKLNNSKKRNKQTHAIEPKIKKILKSEKGGFNYESLVKDSPLDDLLQIIYDKKFESTTTHEKY